MKKGTDGVPAVKAMLGYLVVVILLLAGAEILRRTAAFEEALSAAHEHLTTENPADALAEEHDAGGAPLVASLPVVGRSIDADLRRERALTAYWRADYAALKTPEAEGQPADATTRFIAANAMFRDLAGQPVNSQVLVRGLDAVLKAYASVLEIDPDAVDAAYNYEFVSRLRGAVAAGRTSLKVPSDSNMNGDKGAPPTQTKPGDFNIIVPLRPEEREEQYESGKGALPPRKG
jgi:hypothetical protein